MAFARLFGKDTAFIFPAATEPFRYAYVHSFFFGKRIILWKHKVAPRQHERHRIRYEAERISKPCAGAVLSAPVNKLVIHIGKSGEIFPEHVYLVVAYDDEFFVGKLSEQEEEHRQVLYRHKGLRLVVRQMLKPGSFAACLYDDIIDFHITTN